MHIDYTTGCEQAHSLLLHLTDPEAVRIRKLLDMPDLTRKERSPVQLVAGAVIDTPALHNCDVVKIPEIVSVADNFDLLNHPTDHPARSASDSFYLDSTHVLRTQTTTFWPSYLRDPAVRTRLDAGEVITAVCYGKVYRRDEIDRHHYPVFHQMDGLRVCRKDVRRITLADLSAAAAQIARAIYGPDVICRETGDCFPFTDPSIQLEIQWQEGWLELMGAGLVHPDVLEMLGLDPDIYNGWAFGFGLDRLAMVKMRIPDIRILWLEDPRVTEQFTDLDSIYHDVSKFPATSRDVSMIVDRQIALNRIYEVIRECGEEMIEEVRLIDTYSNPQFGTDRVSYTFRTVYRSHIATLTHEEVNAVQEGVRGAMVREFGAQLR